MSIKIWLDDTGVGDILRRNTELQKTERDMALQKLGEIEASFLQNFGVVGHFEVKMVETRPGQTHGRIAYRIAAADARTAVLLKRNPGWLAGFL